MLGKVVYFFISTQKFPFCLYHKKIGLVPGLCDSRNSKYVYNLYTYQKKVVDFMYRDAKVRKEEFKIL